MITEGVDGPEQTVELGEVLEMVRERDVIGAPSIAVAMPLRRFARFLHMNYGSEGVSDRIDTLGRRKGWVNVDVSKGCTEDGAFLRVSHIDGGGPWEREAVVPRRFFGKGEGGEKRRVVSVEGFMVQGRAGLGSDTTTVEHMVNARLVGRTMRSWMHVGDLLTLEGIGRGVHTHCREEGMV
jgi:hypothetical protein